MKKCLAIAGGLLIGLITLMLTGCAFQKLVVSPRSWEQLESGMYNTAEGRVFFGIGHASGTRNPTLLRASADNHARKALAAVMVNFTNELARSAMVATDPFWAALPVDEQRQILGILVSRSLQKASISDHWSDTRDPGLLALCRLDLVTFKQILSDSAVLVKSTRKAMLSEAEPVHARLSQGI